jgi:ATP-dependent Zn protease
MVFGRDRVTTGAQSDIQRATSIARSYVTHWGLSDAIGPILVGENETGARLAKVARRGALFYFRTGGSRTFVLPYPRTR